jgi:hypothetical protein
MQFTQNRVSWLAILILTWITAGCGSSTKAPDKPAPRTVDGGYIIFVASAEHRSSDRALFLAQGAVTQDIANECSFAPKGTRIEDRYEAEVGTLRKVWVKAAVSFEDCEAAKNAIDPAEIKKLANGQLTEHLKTYEKFVDEDAESELDPEGVEVAEEGPTAAPGPIQSSPQYFLFRQRIARMKQIVILAPSNVYVANSPQTIQYNNAVAGVSQQVKIYSVKNPTIAASPMTWSAVRNTPEIRQYYGARRPMGISGVRRPMYRARSGPRRQMRRGRRR